MSKIINLFGGPGTGKSTTAADLFALMKWNNVSVELVSEYAKEVEWEKRYGLFEDQLYITAKQNHKLRRVNGQVDFIITDSPLLLGLVYASPDYLRHTYADMVCELYETYDNINIFLQREKPYHKVGRSQDEEQARELDQKIKNILEDYQYGIVPANQGAKYAIYDRIKYEFGL